MAATLFLDSTGHLLHKTDPDLSYFELSYRISSYKARGYYFFGGPSAAGIIRMRVLFEGVDYSNR